MSDLVLAEAREWVNTPVVSGRDESGLIVNVVLPPRDRTKSFVTDHLRIGMDRQKEDLVAVRFDRMRQEHMYSIEIHERWTTNTAIFLLFEAYTFEFKLKGSFGVQADVITSVRIYPLKS